MTGIVNSTGARSGVIGTTVGTPVSVATNAADIGSGVLPVGVTGGSGLDLGATCRMYKTSALASTGTGTIYINDYTLDYNDDASYFTPVTSGSPQGIQVLVAGKYLACHSIYTDTHNTGHGFIQYHISYAASSLFDRTKLINVPNRNVVGSFFGTGMSCVLEISVDQVIQQSMNLQVGSCYLNGGTTSSTWVSLTYLG